MQKFITSSIIFLFFVNTNVFSQNTQDSLTNLNSIELQVQNCFQLMPKNIYGKTFIYFLQKNKEFFERNKSYCAVCDTQYYAFSKGEEELTNYYKTVEPYLKSNGIERNKLEYYKTKQITFLKDIIPYGFYCFSYNNNIQALGIHKNGKKHGHWYFSPSKEYIIQALFINGKKEGTWIYYKNNKLTSEITYKNDTIEGKTISYFEDGTVWQESEIKNNKLIYSKLFHENGNLAKEINKYKDSTIEIGYNNSSEFLYKIIYKKGLFYDLEINSSKKFEEIGINGSLKNGSGYVEFKNLIKTKLADSIISENYTVKLNIENCKINGKYIFENGEYIINGIVNNNYLTDKWTKINKKKSKEFKKKYSINDSIKFDNSFHNIHITTHFDNTIIYENPEFPGGEYERLNFIMTNLKYPEEAKHVGAQGVLFTSFELTNYGDLFNFKIPTKIHPSIDNEGLRVIKLMPYWKYGTINGIPSKTTFNMPLNFILQG